MQNSPGCASLDGLAGEGVDDLDLDVRVGAADGRRTPVEVVVGPGLARDRRGLGHAVGDGHLGHVHVVDAPLHHLDRADRAGHDAGAQRRQVVLGEGRVVLHRDEHRRYAVDAGALLGGDRAQGDLGVETGCRDHHGGAVGGAAEVAHDHAEAVVERHRDAEAVVRTEVDQVGDQVAVVEDVAVAERRALGPTGGAGGVLDVDRVVGREPGQSSGDGVVRQVGAGRDQLGPVVGADEDDALETGALGVGLADHRPVVARLEALRADQQAHAGLVDGVGELVGAVGRVDVDQDRPRAWPWRTGRAPTRHSWAPRSRPGRPPPARRRSARGPARRRPGRARPRSSVARWPRRPAPRGRAVRPTVRSKLAPIVSSSSGGSSSPAAYDSMICRLATHAAKLGR